AVGDRAHEGGVLGIAGDLHLELGALDEAGRYYARALAAVREVDDRRFEGWVLTSTGLSEQELGRFAEARARLLEALTIHRAVGDERSQGMVLVYLAHLALEEGRLEESCMQYDAAAPMLGRSGGDHRLRAQLLAGRTVAAARHGKVEATPRDLEKARA